jgi:DNA-binding transcriptional LysR family regulator
MTFLQIKYFLKVCETGNISSAAQELYISRSALSKAIREMEIEFNTALFDRTKAGLALTAAGEMLYSKAL